ncbi:spermatogenesis-associated protein 17 [Nelusetta ayraudi]|uniref:spermatogenesis-associated protein 17 n=1 Tax=Nelusetta ayraudi TaxID=303726 RepID=UPI003F71AF33
MAEVLKIESAFEEFKKEFVSRNREAEENRQKEHDAAILIQSWFRACKVRAYLRHLHKKAVIIQKIWRGFTARAHFRQMVKAAYFIMKMNFYEAMAVKIQQIWRGFFVRKYVHNFYTRKSYLEGIARNNEIVRMELDELEEFQKRERDYVQMMEEQSAKTYEAYRLHHLLSTKQRPGIFNSPFRPEPHEMEHVLRQVRYHAPNRLATKGRSNPLGTALPATPNLPGTQGSSMVQTPQLRGYCRPPLPPIAGKKKQGPFQEPREAGEQRALYSDPASQLQSPHFHQEEAKNCLRQHKSARLHRGGLGPESLPHHLRPSLTLPDFRSRSFS